MFSSSIFQYLAPKLELIFRPSVDSVHRSCPFGMLSVSVRPSQLYLHVVRNPQFSQFLPYPPIGPEQLFLASWFAKSPIHSPQVWRDIPQVVSWLVRRRRVVWQLGNSFANNASRGSQNLHLDTFYLIFALSLRRIFCTKKKSVLCSLGHHLLVAKFSPMRFSNLQIIF